MTNDRPVILIVDDTPLTLTFLAEVLDTDYRIKTATNGPDALALANRPPYPDLILLDVMMPEMDGYAVCAALQRGATTAAIPVLFITARTDADSETQALAGGAVDFIHKPINPAVVRARVRLHLELVQHRQHLEAQVFARTLALAQARDAAESANRAKTAFLANMSHEMRTPLNHIGGLIHLLRPVIPDPQCQRWLDQQERAVRHLTTLVKDILDLSRLESGDLAIANQPFAAEALLRQVAEDHADAITAKGLTLVQEVASDVPASLDGDADQLRRILGHLLDNAVKFSERGQITLRVRSLERQGQRWSVRFEVADQGIGMSPTLATQMFQLFHQGDNSMTRRFGGTGLGLTLCQRLVMLMGGTIDLVSTPGQGTTVGVSVPLGIGGVLDANVG